VNLANIPERIARRIEVDAASGCWLWTGAATSDGYGGTRWHGQHVGVHRLTYHLLVDASLPIRPGGPHAGLQLDHLCEVRNCCNPAHLEPVTHAENHRRRIERHPRPVALAADDARHGTLNGYTHWDCRCEPCYGAAASYRAALRGAA